MKKAETTKAEDKAFKRFEAQKDHKEPKSAFETQKESVEKNIIRFITPFVRRVSDK